MRAVQRDDAHAAVRILRQHGSGHARSFLMRRRVLPSLRGRAPNGSSVSARRHPQLALDRGRQRGGQRLGRCRTLRQFRLDRQHIVRRRAVEHDAVLARQRRLAVQHGGDLDGKDVDAAHHHHVVAAPDHAEARRGSAAGGAAGAGQFDDVAGAEAHQRLAFARQVRQHQFAALALPPRQHRAALRRHQFGVQHVQRHEMQVGVLLGLAGEVAEHVGDAVIGVARLHAPGVGDAPPQLGVVQPRLAAEQAEPQAEIARFQAGKMLGQRAAPAPPDRTACRRSR